MVPWAHPSPQLKRHLDRCSHYFFAELTTVTDRQTSTRDLDLDLGSGHTAYRRASLKYQISLKSEKKLFCGRPIRREGPLQVQGHVTQKLGQIAKSRPDQGKILCCSLRISGHLPAAVVNDGGDKKEECNFPNLRIPMTLILTLDRVIRHTFVYHSRTSIYVPNFIEIGRTSLWTD